LQRRRGNVGLPATPSVGLPGVGPTRTVLAQPLGAKTTLTPAQALSPAYGNKWNEALTSARAYQKANPDIPFLNQLDDASINKQIDVYTKDIPKNKMMQTTGRTIFQMPGILGPMFGVKPKALRVELDPKSEPYDQASETLRHEMRHTTQTLDNFPKHESFKEYVTSPAELTARLPELNAAWLRRGGEFPKTPEDARRIMEHYGLVERTLPNAQLWGPIHNEAIPTPDGGVITPWGNTPAKDYINKERDAGSSDVEAINDSLQLLEPAERDKQLDRIMRLLPGVVDNNPVTPVKIAALLRVQ
jgi:hypothetical protein